MIVKEKVGKYVKLTKTRLHWSVPDEHWWTHIYTKTHNRYRIYKKDIAQEEAQNI